MSTTTAQMGLLKPDNGGSVGTWGTELRTTIDTIDAHDHTTGKGPKVPTAGINVNADLSFAGFGATNLKVVDLAAVLASSVTGYPTALFVNSADNELYWRTSGGSNVKLTSGTSLNAALLGGFTGDYGSGGSEANFSSGTSIYNFLRAANHRAFIDASDIRLFQGSSGITNAVRIKSPNALAASYDFVFPTALPGSQSLLHVDAAGQVSASNSLATNASITVSGTGQYKRPARVRHIHITAGEIVAGTGTFTGAGVFVSGGATDAVHVPLGVQEGERITAVAVRVAPNAAGAVQLRVFKIDASMVVAQLGSTQNSSGTSLQTLTVSGLTEAVDSTAVAYYAIVDAGQASDVFSAVLLTTDVP